MDKKRIIVCAAIIAVLVILAIVIGTALTGRGETPQPGKETTGKETIRVEATLGSFDPSDDLIGPQNTEGNVSNDQTEGSEEATQGATQNQGANTGTTERTEPAESTGDGPLSGQETIGQFDPTEGMQTEPTGTTPVPSKPNENTQNTTPSKPDGNTQPSEPEETTQPVESSGPEYISFEEYLAMSGEEQMAYAMSFGDWLKYQEWYLKAQKEYENGDVIEIGPTIDWGDIFGKNED